MEWYKHCIGAFTVILGGGIAYILRLTTRPLPVFTETQIKQILQTEKHYSNTKYAKIDGEYVLWNELGNPSGDAVILFQGLSMSPFAYNSHNEYFLKQNWRVIIPQLWGDLADHRRHTWTDLANRVHGLVKHLGIKKSHVIAQSAGTTPAIAYLQMFPECVNKAGLFGSMLPLSEHSSDLIPLLKDDTKLVIKLLLFSPTLTKAIFWMAMKISPITEESVKTQWLDAKVPQAEKEYVRSVAAKFVATGANAAIKYCGPLALLVYYGDFISSQRLLTQTITCDLYIETGLADNVHLPQFSEIVHRMAPQSRLYIDKNGGRFNIVGKFMEEGMDRMFAS